MNEKTAEYYLDLPYTIELVHDTSDSENPVWFAAVRELRGCMTEADSLDEAVRQIRDAMHVWLTDAIESDEPIPQPRHEEEFSGKFSLRLPRSLHRDVVAQAEREGVSLNQYITSILSREIGAR